MVKERGHGHPGRKWLRLMCDQVSPLPPQPEPLTTSHDLPHWVLHTTQKVMKGVALIAIEVHLPSCPRPAKPSPKSGPGLCFPLVTSPWVLRDPAATTQQAGGQIQAVIQTERVPVS